MNLVARELALDEAQAWFDAMPRPQRLPSLAPRFARADARRREGLECVHVGMAQGPARWLCSLHLRGLGASGRAVLSPYGYGGALCNVADPAFIVAAQAGWQAWCRQRGVVAETWAFHPQTQQHTLFAGTVAANRPVVSVDLTRADVGAQYNTLARRKIRRAQGASIQWSTAPADWKHWAGFYRRAMAALGAAARYHFSDGYFDALAQVPGVELLVLREGDEWLSAGVYLFPAHLAGDEEPGGVLEYHLGASSAAGHQRGTAYLLQHAAALEGQRRGLASLFLGGGTSAAPDNPLLFYKRCFSRRMRTFHTGFAVHDAARFAALARARGYDPACAPANLLTE